MAQSELIYEHSTAWQKRFESPVRRTSFPTPSPSWQEREYEALMGELPPPPPEEHAWQWDYNPRKKASQKAFLEFAPELVDVPADDDAEAGAALGA